MKNPVKIVTIGGGSSYTPELMEGFIKRYDMMPIREIWLVDIEEGREKLEIVGALAQRMWDASGHKVKVHMTLDREEALKDADFVTTQFRVGLLNARIKDERIPLSYGMIGQETNGAGGIFKAFRTVPVILDIVEDMKRLCPNAWLINFTNPSGMITEAVMRYGKWDKVIGLCNVPVGSIIMEPEQIGCKEEDLIYKFAGLNHFHWHKVYDSSGNDVTLKIAKRLLEYAEDPTAPRNIKGCKWQKDQLEEANILPCAYHRYYYLTEEMLNDELREYNSKEGTRAQQVQAVEHELFELYKNPNLHEKPAQLALRGGAHYSDAACETIASIYSNSYKQMVVSTKNNGAVSDLPDDCVVEVSSFITGHGPLPIAFGSLGDFERGFLQLMKSMELLTIEAAVTGSYAKAVEAFTINPLITSGSTSIKVLNELLIAHKKYLPQFKDKIKELEDKNITVKDDVVRDLCERGL